MFRRLIARFARPVAVFTLRRLFTVIAPRAAVSMTAGGGAVGYHASIHDLRGEVVTEEAMPEIPIEVIEEMDLRGELPTHPTLSYPRRDVGRVNLIIWHHTAATAQPIRTTAQFHVQGNNWPGIGYHDGIGYDGKYYLMNSHDRATYHAQGYNARSIGMVLIGNFETNEVPEAMKRTIEKAKRRNDKRYPGAQNKLHRDTKATACPGRHATEFLRAVL